jgi:YgiT-type zinc finger domain-containing protein
MFRFRSDDHFVCPVCHLGHMNLKLAVYTRMFVGTLVHVPNMPVWECDVCRNREFEAMSIQRIEMLVGEAGPPPNHYRPPERPVERRTVPANPASSTAKLLSMPKPKPTKAAKPRAKLKSQD